MPALPEELIAELDRLGLAHALTRHEAVFTVAQSQELRGTMIGLHSKNLFLKDKKGRLFLVSARDSASIDLKHLHEAIGASGRLSFGSADLLLEKLGVTPGSVTAFAVINDPAGEVTLVLDAGLMTGETLHFHPLINTATVAIGLDDMLAFLRSTGHEPLIVDLPAPRDGQNASSSPSMAGSREQPDRPIFK